MKPNPCKVIIVDDHVLLRDALANLINSFEIFKVAAVAGNGEELITIINNGIVPDIVILDINMPVMGGYLTAEWLEQNYPDVKILTLTMFDTEVALIKLLRLGVRGFLKKDIHPAELKQALISVNENGYYYANSTTGKLASFFFKTNASQASIEKALLSQLEIDFFKACRYRYDL